VLEQFEKAWRSHRHEKRDTLHTEIQTLLTALDRERKRSRTILTICAMYTLASLIGSAFIFSSRDVPVSEVWPVAVAQVLAFSVLAYAIRSRFSRNRPESTSVRDAAVSALAETRAGIGTLKLIAISMGGILVLLAIAVMALLDSGKMNAQAVTSFASVCLLIVIFNGSLLTLKWKTKLRPRRDRLSEIVRDLESK
jgi:cation transport ATPase